MRAHELRNTTAKAHAPADEQPEFLAKRRAVLPQWSPSASEGGARPMAPESSPAPTFGWGWGERPRSLPSRRVPGLPQWSPSISEGWRDP